MFPITSGYVITIRKRCYDLAGLPYEYGTDLYIVHVPLDDNGQPEKVITMPNEKRDDERDWLFMKPVKGYYEFDPMTLVKAVNRCWKQE